MEGHRNKLIEIARTNGNQEVKRLLWLQGSTSTLIGVGDRGFESRGKILRRGLSWTRTYSSNSGKAHSKHPLMAFSRTRSDRYHGKRTRKSLFASLVSWGAAWKIRLGLSSSSGNVFSPTASAPVMQTVTQTHVYRYIYIYMESRSIYSFCSSTKLNSLIPWFSAHINTDYSIFLNNYAGN